jgi:hypothetical protein
MNEVKELSAQEGPFQRVVTTKLVDVPQEAWSWSSCDSRGAILPVESASPAFLTKNVVTTFRLSH